MKKLLIFGAITTLVFSACKKTAVNPESETAPTLIDSKSIDAFIKKSIQATGSFDWSTASDEMIWSALQQSDNVLSVGYQPAGMGDISEKLHLIDIREAAWKVARSTVMQGILNEERKLDASLTESAIVPWEEYVLPVINVYVKNISTIRLLRASKLVRYTEPMGYEPKEIQTKVAGSSGCGSNVAEPGLIANVDYMVIAPNTKQSWNYSYHNIPTAWEKATGAGIKVFIIDTGCEFDQENLGNAFNQGSSAGRTIEKIVTLPRSTFFGIPTGPVETPDDGCGHGTSMAGACAAPRGTDGAACGVAYNCNLVTCRAAEDVLLDESREVKGASDGFTNAGNRGDVKIISMSMGKMTSSSQLSDAIKYAYGKGKLIFCAAGTSFSWTAGWYGVVFPANLSQVNAVTGVRDNSFNTTCTSCHKGSETDFTIVMEKALNERHPLSLAMSGDSPSTVGGSSVSTATAAGIAALVWSRNPALSRDAILNKLIQTSSNYPVKNSSLGWGNMNAEAAVN